MKRPARVVMGLLLVALLQSFNEAKARPPNILLITADNLGYGDLRCNNPEATILSPHLDALAARGARLTDFYTASPTCTVSRACLLTGRIPQRHGLLDQLAGVEGNYGVGLRQSEMLIPQLLKRAESAYVSGCFGKWNIGFAPGSRPTERGFDEFVGHASGNMDYYHHVYNGRHDLYRGTQPLHADGTYSTDLFADAAIDFIHRQSRQDRPWFCYLPFNAPHFPNQRNKQPGQPNAWQAPAWALKRYGYDPAEPDPRKRYEAVVTALDAAIGRVLQALDEAGVREETFIFFMSDNGAFRLDRDGLDVGINTPLRSGGVTCWEGGIRVVALAAWDGHIRPGTIVDHPLWSPDVLPTCQELAGISPGTTPILDGQSFLAVLKGEPSGMDRSLFFTYRSHAALRAGEWKIVREKPDHPWQLYHLTEDASESLDRASLNPDKLEELVSQYRQWLDRLP